MQCEIILISAGVPYKAYHGSHRTSNVSLWPLKAHQEMVVVGYHPVWSELHGDCWFYDGWLTNGDEEKRRENVKPVSNHHPRKKQNRRIEKGDMVMQVLVARVLLASRTCAKDYLHYLILSVVVVD